MKKILGYFQIITLLLLQNSAFALDREKMLRDSTIKYGVEIEPYLKSLTNQKIDKDFNYSPYINKFLKEHKYVKFPPYPISIGIDDSFPRYRSHLVVKSGNRLYFPKGSALVSLPALKTNGYMVFVAWDVSDVFIDGISLIGSKANTGYKTSMYGAGIAMYGSSNILISNARITKSSGDGLTVRVQWKKQSQDITINNLAVVDATRVGMLVTGIVNGNFKNISIEGTGEKTKGQVVKPQTALSFEPNDCTSKYVNCRFENLNTKNNLGPVLATTNFYNIYTKNTCGVNKIDVLINKWKDITDDPACYGASFDVASGDMGPYDTRDVSGTFKIVNATIVRNTPAANYYFFHGQGETRKGGVKYTITNLKLIHQGKTYDLNNRSSDKNIKSMIDKANSSNKVSIN